MIITLRAEVDPFQNLFPRPVKETTGRTICPRGHPDPFPGPFLLAMKDIMVPRGDLDPFPGPFLHAMKQIMSPSAGPQVRMQVVPMTRSIRAAGHGIQGGMRRVIQDLVLDPTGIFTL